MEEDNGKSGTSLIFIFFVLFINQVFKVMLFILKDEKTAKMSLYIPVFRHS